MIMLSSTKRADRSLHAAMVGVIMTSSTSHDRADRFLHEVRVGVIMTTSTERAYKISSRKRVINCQAPYC